MAKGVSLGMRLFNDRALAKTLRALRDKLNGALQDDLAKHGARLLNRSMSSVPVLSGALSRSRFITPAGKNAVRAGFSAQHAAAVHEGVHGKRSRPGTRGFKFLERVADSYAPEFVNGMKDALIQKIARILGNDPNLRSMNRGTTFSAEAGGGGVTNGDSPDEVE